MVGPGRPRRGKGGSLADNSPRPKSSSTVNNSAAQSDDTDDDSTLSNAIQTVSDKLLTDEKFISKLVSAIKTKLLDEICESLRSEVKASLKFDIDNTNDNMAMLEKRVDLVEEAMDEAEQYSRRSCLISAGINETQDENVEETIMNICKNDLDVTVEKGDIDRCHRLGNVNYKGRKTRKQHRDIIVKFTNYRKRDSVYKARFSLRKTPSRYPLAVITHVDVVEQALVEKLCTVLHKSGVSDIFEVANLTTEKIRLEELYQLNLLNLMNKCIIEGDEILIFKYVECKWRELMRRHEMMISECARTGAQRHEYPDSFALERERMAALKRERVAVLERERSKAQGQEREATLEREGEAALERERMAALKWKREVALEREKVAVLERERSEALERERSEAQERERMAALEQKRMAALERERMIALERERVAILGRERSEAQGREREAALEDTIMGMKRDMQIMVTAERERQASLEDSKQGTKMPFNPKRETSPSSPPSRTSLIEQLRGAFSSKTRQTSHRSTGETLDNISGAQEDFDKQLTTVAQKVARRDEIDNLGKALGFEPEDIQRYVDTNMKSESYMGTLSMLRDWRKKQTKAKECGALNSVLMKVRQIRLADELFGTS